MENNKDNIISKTCLSCSKPTDNCYLNGVTLCPECVMKLIKTRTPEPTKAENGLDEKAVSAIVWRLYKCGEPERAIKEIMELATPSITKEQLLAILPEEQYSIGSSYHNACRNQMKQSIEGLFDK